MGTNQNLAVPIVPVSKTCSRLKTDQQVYAKDKKPYYGQTGEFRIINKVPQDKITVPIQLADLTNFYPDQSNLRILQNRLNNISQKESVSKIASSGAYVKDPQAYYDPSANENVLKQAVLAQTIIKMKQKIDDAQTVAIKEEVVNVRPYVQNYENSNKEDSNEFIGKNLYYPVGKNEKGENIAGPIGADSTYFNKPVVVVNSVSNYTTENNTNSSGTINSEKVIVEAEIIEDVSLNKDVKNTNDSTNFDNETTANSSPQNSSAPENKQEIYQETIIASTDNTKADNTQNTNITEIDASVNSNNNIDQLNNNNNEGTQTTVQNSQKDNTTFNDQISTNNTDNSSQSQSSEESTNSSNQESSATQNTTTIQSDENKNDRENSSNNTEDVTLVPSVNNNTSSNSTPSSSENMNSDPQPQAEVKSESTTPQSESTASDSSSQQSATSNSTTPQSDSTVNSDNSQQSASTNTTTPVEGANSTSNSTLSEPVQYQNNTPSDNAVSSDEKTGNRLSRTKLNRKRGDDNLVVIPKKILQESKSSPAVTSDKNKEEKSKAPKVVTPSGKDFKKTSAKAESKYEINPNAPIEIGKKVKLQISVKEYATVDDEKAKLEETTQKPSENKVVKDSFKTREAKKQDKSNLRAKTISDKLAEKSTSKTEEILETSKETPKKALRVGENIDNVDSSDTLDTQGLKVEKVRIIPMRKLMSDAQSEHDSDE